MQETSSRNSSAVLYWVVFHFIFNLINENIILHNKAKFDYCHLFWEIVRYRKAACQLWKQKKMYQKWSMLLLFLKMEYNVHSFFKKGCLEVRGRSHRNYYSRMKRYLYDFWNAVDLLSYILLIAALFVRHFYSDSSFTIARRMFALSLLVMYLRFLEVFLVHRKMGPTLIMIKEMVCVI